MLTLAIIGLVWATLSAVAFALCVLAARGDGPAGDPVVAGRPGTRRSGRFTRSTAEPAAADAETVAAV